MEPTDKTTPEAEPTVTVTFKKPVKLGDASYAAITMREATIGDQVDVTQQGMTTGDVELAIIAKVSGMPVAAVRKIPLGDYGKVQALLANFPSSPATAFGEASSGSAGQPA